MSSDDGTREATSRRTVLEGATGAAAVAAVPSTVAGAGSLQGRREMREKEQELESDYSDEELARLLESGGRPVLKVLAAEGFIDAPTTDAFGVDVDESNAVRTTDAVAATVGYDEEEGEAVVRLWSRTTTDEYRITLLVEPDGSERFAIVEGPQREESYLVEDGEVSEIEYAESASDCEWCQSFCDNAMGPIVRGTDPESSCATTDCYREPTCEECPDQDKCDDGFWL